MIRVLFIWPPKIEYIFSIQKHYTSFGETIAYLDQNENILVDVMDGSALLYFQWDFISAYARNYDFLVVYTDLHNGISAIKAAKQCKKISPNTITISYGQGTPYIPKVLLENGFDAAVIDAMYQKSILNYILYKQRIVKKENLRGIWYWENEKIQAVNVFYDHDIKDIAFPALNKIPVEQYKKISGRDQICFTTMRGCIYSCRFCRVPIADSRNVSYRPIPEILDYVKKVKDDFASVKFISANFTVHRNWVLEFCDEVLSSGIQFQWIVTTRIELLDEELLAAMSKAGCIAIAFGMETLYEETQKKIDKYIPRESLIKQINLIHKYKIIPKAFIMLGIPGQDKNEILEMFEFLKIHKVQIRPKEYYPYEELLNGSDKLELLKFFERNDVYKIHQFLE